MQRIKNKMKYFLGLAYMFLFAPAAHAQALGGGGCNNEEIYTAIGCIPISGRTEFLEFFLTWAYGIGGGIALLLISYGAFLYITSAGDPKKTQAARELIVAAISGLVFLIFSAFLIRFIGVDILQFDIS